MACSVCNGFIRPYRRTRIDVAELQKSVQSGCAYCDVILQALDGMLFLSDIASLTIATTSTRSMQISVEAAMGEGYKVKMGEKGPSSHVYVEEVVLYVGKGDPVPSGSWINTLHEIPLDPSSPESIEFINENLQTCLSTHPCNLTLSAPPLTLPKRVVNISTNPASLKLLAYDESLGPYIALSHCWGGPIALQLTKSTTKELFLGIDPDQLPNTFSDAINVTSQLGIKNIWIDSLCICQDSKEDWAEEAAKMGDIYRNAILTIAGASSASSKQSFLAERKTKRDEPTIEVFFNDGSNGVRYTLKATRFMDLHEDAESGNGANAPLHQRAWCFQEYFLSTRIVSFEPTEIRFRCLSAASCQCSPSPPAIPTDTYEIIRFADEFSDAEILSCWADVVNSYSSRKLTFARDRLPALAGTAATIARSTGWTYLAGIWTEQFVRCLCWYTVSAPGAKLPGMVVPAIAPSFSWASVLGEVGYELASGYDPKTDILARIVQTDCRLGSQNAFGEVEEAFIVVDGPVLEAYCVVADTSNADTYYIEFGKSRWRFDPDTQLAAVQIGEGKLVAGRTEQSPPQQLANMTVSILFLATSIWEDRFSVHALVVREMNRSERLYERIGILSEWGEGLENDVGTEGSHHRLQMMDLIDRAQPQLTKIV